MKQFRFEEPTQFLVKDIYNRGSLYLQHAESLIVLLSLRSCVSYVFVGRRVSLSRLGVEFA